MCWKKFFEKSGVCRNGDQKKKRKPSDRKWGWIGFWSRDSENYDFVFSGNFCHKRQNKPSHRDWDWIGFSASYAPICDHDHWNNLVVWQNFSKNN
jgi:hypothetical protein